MVTRELDESEWLGFFNAFSQRYRGVPMTLDISAGQGDTTGEIIARRLPLVGITAECRCGDDRVTAIEIMLGASIDDHLIHTVNNPTRVFIGQISNGAVETILIHSLSDPPVQLDFRDRSSLDAAILASGRTPDPVWSHDTSVQSTPPP